MKSATFLSKLNRQNLIPQELLQEKPYVETTNHIEVSVWPEFIDKKTSVLGNLFIWAYHVRIVNKSATEIKLIARFWRIIDECGNVQEIEGDGVVGEQPVILPNSSYQYSSGVHLKYPSGIMSGKYRIKKLNNDEVIEIKIPNFSLDIPSAKKILN
ncbi:MAG: Co2+/Mg2+ efflux protein ApaG [Alphaproteobacteria bacterium]|nr:Co2+/Mg2+ efflux protein ApaG [Alphaproteobacteria bacterium]